MVLTLPVLRILSLNKISSILTVAVLWENLCKIRIIWPNIASNHQRNTQGLEFSLSEDIKLGPIT